MEHFYGFDLGDAESAISSFNGNDSQIPSIIPIQNKKSFVTAYAIKKDGTLLIGEEACYEPNVTLRKDRFKRKFLTDPDSHKDIAAFAGGVLGELFLSASLIKDGQSCFYIGCPAGWDASAREEYRMIFEKCGYPPIKIISESRAALISACQSKHLQVGYDILHKPVLVIDIGSSTTDFAYINAGHEVALKTGGEVFLGGGIMDEILLEHAIDTSKDAKKIRKVFTESPQWHSFCDFAARKLKEKYFTDEEYWRSHECVQNIAIHQSFMPLHLTLRMNQEIADLLLNQKSKQIGNKSFHEAFIENLNQVADSTKDNPPELIFLTGGVSKLSAVKNWCRGVFKDAVVICGSEPEFSVSRGLSYCGRIDEEIREFKSEIERLVNSSAVEQIVEKHIGELYQSVVAEMVDPILENCAIPVVDKWRIGEIEKLSDIDEVLKKDIDAYMHTDDAREHLAKPVGSWLKKISYELEEYTMPICIRHHVPYQQLSFHTYLSLTDLSVEIAAKDLFALKEITLLIDTTVSLMIGLLCGGSGIALIANGLPGIAAGIVVSFLALALGKDKMEKFMLDSNIPKVVRKLIPKAYIRGRLDVISEQVKVRMLKMLEEVKNEEITDRVAGDLSKEIERCLLKMAEVVEIPLGN